MSSVAAPLSGSPPAPPDRSTPIAAFILRAFVLPPLLLIGVAAAVVAGVDRNARRAALVTASQARLTLIEATAQAVSELENGQRGFGITGDEAFLQPYARGQVALEQHLRELAARSVSAQQGANVERVRALTQSWNVQSARPEIAARRGSPEQAAALVSDGSGKHTLDEVRNVLGVMRANENTRLRAAVDASAAPLKRVRLLTLAGLLLSAGLLVLAALRTARTLSDRLALIPEHPDTPPNVLPSPPTSSFCRPHRRRAPRRQLARAEYARRGQHLHLHPS